MDSKQAIATYLAAFRSGKKDEPVTDKDEAGASGILSIIEALTWIKIWDRYPPIGALVIARTKNAKYLCVYEKSFTWKGFKLKFINKLSRYGMVVERVIDWSYLP